MGKGTEAFMGKRHVWDPKMCFYCSALDMRAAKGGRVVYWCERRQHELTNAFIWKRCRHFQPVAAN